MKHGNTIHLNLSLQIPGFMGTCKLLIYKENTIRVFDSLFRVSCNLLILLLFTVGWVHGYMELCFHHSYADEYMEKFYLLTFSGSNVPMYPVV